MKSAQSADAILAEKDEQASQILQDMANVHQKAMEAQRDNQLAYDKASEAKNRSLGELERANAVQEAMQTFFNQEKATPESTKELADQARKKQL